MNDPGKPRFRLKDLGLWRAGGAVACLMLLAAIFAFPSIVLPVVALLCGGLFFLYGVKSYASVAIIMLSTTGANGNGNQNGDRHKGRRSGLLGRLKGGKGKNPSGGIGNGKPNRLPPDKQPFISIQLPMYNEGRVVDRLLAACTQLDYENYEVLVADDSSDETLSTLERWAKHPKVRVSHRINRSGFKGAALKHASEVMSPKTEFVAVFDADFIPPPDILHQFLAYFYGVPDGNTGTEAGSEPYLLDESLAVVQGYQWHVLNASENWITRGIRAEFAGSYVIERSSQELTGGMKMISGSVFMIRADVLRKHKWGTSITEDWELTLRLYLDGYKVLYSPFIQAPAECVSDFKQLTRQRMRWAEGHTFNVKRYFLAVMRSPNLTLRE
ncbi:MAG: glycosyltransferase, partial [Anaerolineales bacterium]